MKSRTITVDTSVGACYIALSDCPVTRTEEFSDDVLVDLNEYGVAVGIEILDLNAQLPLTDLCRQLHIHSSDEPYLVKLLTHNQQQPGQMRRARHQRWSATRRYVHVPTRSARAPGCQPPPGAGEPDGRSGLGRISRDAPGHPVSRTGRTRRAQTTRCRPGRAGWLGVRGGATADQERKLHMGEKDPAGAGARFPRDSAILRYPSG